MEVLLQRLGASPAALVASWLITARAGQCDKKSYRKYYIRNLDLDFLVFSLFFIGFVEPIATVRPYRRSAATVLLSQFFFCEHMQWLQLHLLHRVCSVLSCEREDVCLAGFHSARAKVFCIQLNSC
eukprot:gnl/TRDRNA2_/TRDRNA2_129411_c0_seq1.p1 gnl/TRDRNA2_/TRDRNA2_129411_c0~~gnl/TRDRNA2_/TRDRNA2_129411_c0_seq1.p1  ORF type:complete len:126 (-),score=3.02 gnl/TRDRNA2_/TRDRNA2_129411_c0_seq1:137-514(-)